MPFNGHFVAQVVSFAQQQGASTDKLYEVLGLDEQELMQDGLKVSNESFGLMLESALMHTQDPIFGLHMGESMGLSAAGLILQIVQSCRTIREAFGYICQFANLGCSSLPMQLEEQGDRARVFMVPDAEWHKRSPRVVQQVGDGVLAFTLREFNSLTLHRQNPIIAGSPFAMEMYRADYERILGTRISFRRDCFELVFHRSELDKRIMSANYELLQVLVSHAEQRISQMERLESWTTKIKRLALQMANPEFPTIEALSSNLNLNPRTLQRRLKEEGQAYRGLIEELRQQKSVVYLSKLDMSINDIAYLLGYSEPGSFIRSFKRWKGISPQAFREQKDNV